ncbi:MAG: enoyl-CoA hydratase/isomerase family protein [Rubellimicrobium sp.]|nr:enoyl-CoA hydratase/isomerase family protein [Rubellimicrobium sp.]
MPYETILTETRGRVRLVTLNRPKALNALNRQLAGELLAELDAADRDPAIGCMVVTGSARAFAAGADIGEMAEETPVTLTMADHFGEWDQFAALRKPVIAAVAGYALGGGCELALMCDTIIAADTATFGQPEIRLGIVPGMGGSQRLTRAVGPAKAMEMILTGRNLTADEAERAGLVARVVAADDLLAEAMTMAETIARQSLPAVIAAKEAVRAALDSPLAEGLRHERALFRALFATEDQKEGMRAFQEKREAQFQNR